MESIYAALLLHKASKKITEAAIEKILKAAGVEVEKSNITKLIAGLKQKNIDEIIASAATTPVIAAPVATEGKTTKIKPKEAEKEEEEEEEEPTGIGSLF
ncbi:MAG: 50S ribosomal protein L12 [Promethearchaeota archaeon]